MAAITVARSTGALTQAMPVAAELPRSFGVPPAEVTETFWRSLRYFSLYRLVVASVFMLAYVLTDGAGKLGSQNGLAFLLAASFYLAVAIGFLFSLAYWPRRFNLQLTVQVACDIAALTVIMYASGGAKSGVAIMLVIVVAAAGLVGQGRLTLFYAAMATIMVLGEQAVRVISFDAQAEDFLRTGLTCIGFFAAAAIAQLLARRVVANEALARQRGLELADQIRVNEQVVRDMDDGILVVDAAGRITLHNPQASTLLGMTLAANASLAGVSPVLTECLAQQRDRAGAGTLPISVGHRQVLARFVAPEASGKTLIYLQDFGRVQAQAQQIKLAALGRLTANIAHEIRNPLAAISHAAELLAEEQRGEMRSRLIRIIGDNGARLNRLVGEILELGRRDRALPEAIPLGAFLRQFVDEYALQHDGARERLRLAGVAPGTLSFDRTHLYRVLENLVTNALRYASAAPGAVVIEAVAGADIAELHVIDDGPGIPAAERGKVFEPFFTTHSTGTGLGLYIAKELCEANGASLELLDTPTGAHFRITAKRDDA